MKRLLPLLAGISLHSGYAADYYGPIAPRATQVISEAASDMTTLCWELWKYDQKKLPLEERITAAVEESYLWPNNAMLKERIYHISFKDKEGLIDLKLYMDKYTVFDHRHAWVHMYGPSVYENKEETVIGIVLRIVAPQYVFTIEDSGADGIGETNPILVNWLPLQDYAEYNGQPLHGAGLNNAYAKALLATKQELERRTKIISSVE